MRKKIALFLALLLLAGLLAAALASVISAVRRRWYRRYGSDLETIAECLLEVLKLEKEAE